MDIYGSCQKPKNAQKAQQLLNAQGTERLLGSEYAQRTHQLLESENAQRTQ